MTPLIKFDSVYLKREDQNITGSAKDRATEIQVKHLKDLGFTNAVISSSGNAAISSQYFCQQAGIILDIFVSPAINPAKLKLLDPAHLHTTAKPISDAFKFAKLHHSYLLRQSTDKIALTGYKQIGKELILQLPEITSLFVPVGSGTTLLGISQILSPIVKLFGVQPAAHCPIASDFDKNFTAEIVSQTDALSVKSLPLKYQVISAIKNSNGSGIVIQDDDVIKCQKLLSNRGINTSAEGALALAGYYKAKKSLDLGNFPIILLTGVRR
jgi:threonine synthase